MCHADSVTVCHRTTFMCYFLFSRTIYVNVRYVDNILIEVDHENQLHELENLFEDNTVLKFNEENIARFLSFPSLMYWLNRNKNFLAK